MSYRITLLHSPVNSSLSLIALMLLCFSYLGKAISQDNVTWSKIEVPTSGVYQITGQWLRNQIQNLPESLPSSSINLWGVSGGPLHHDSNWNATERILPIPLWVEDGGDGRLDDSDRILFYLEGPDAWAYEDGEMTFVKNPFSLTAHYLIKISSDEPIRINQESTEESNEAATDLYEFFAIHHEDAINLLGSDVGTTGSGQLWVGEEITNFGLLSLQNRFPESLPSLNQPTITIALAGRSKQSESATIRIGQYEERISWSPVNTGDVEELYARLPTAIINLDSYNNDFIELEYEKKDGEARLWVDYIKISGIKKIENDGLPIIINNNYALKNKSYHLQLPDGNLRVWNVSNIHNTAEVIPNDLNQIESDLEKQQSYFLFPETQIFPLPISSNNQRIEFATVDLNTDMLVIYPDAFANAAKEFADHRESYSSIKVNTVSVASIYNSYSAGRKDPTAIRNYIRDHVRKEGKLEYVLLLGDASYDYRHLDKSLPDTDFIPTFETFESLDPLFAFPSDDYFALLDDGENGVLRGNLDINIGRLTARTVREADVMVKKIINYDLQEPDLAPWKKKLVFVADDEDRNLHLNDADDIAIETKRNYPVFNQEKIYFDAFSQVSTPGGNRYPAATERLNSIIEKGALIINYLGHGGPRGWAQERVLKIDDIISWKNQDRLPLIITATCSFTGFDDPALTSAGEEVMLNPVGGAIALFTTVRSVFASKNFRLTQAVYRQLFEREGGQYFTLGEIMKRAKNNLTNDALNGRKFFLIGDPSLRLKVPDYTVSTTSINGLSTTSDQIVDTVGALGRIKIEGEILTTLGEVAEDYNGTMQLELFDKPTEVQTLGNDERSFLTTFSAQTNSLYKGIVKVENGIFSAEAVVPVDINYRPGLGRISYAAISDDGISAMGHNEQFLIAGFSDNPIVDDQSPSVSLYLNDRNFTSGDVVGQSNLLIADISDNVGINISSVGIGHEMIAEIDGEIEVITEFYTPNVGDPTTGVILFSLPELSSGQHTLRVTVFDVANNPGTATVDFVIDEDFLYTIQKVEASPNPALSGPINFDITTTHISTINEVVIEMYSTTGQLISKESQLLPNNNGRILATANKPETASQIVVCKVSIKNTEGSDVVHPIFKKLVFLK